jgi:hypothetical protein
MNVIFYNLNKMPLNKGVQSIIDRLLWVKVG